MSNSLDFDQLSTSQMQDVLESADTASIDDNVLINILIKLRPEVGEDSIRLAWDNAGKGEASFKRRVGRSSGAVRITMTACMGVLWRNGGRCQADDNGTSERLYNSSEYERKDKERRVEELKVMKAKDSDIRDKHSTSTYESSDYFENKHLPQELILLVNRDSLNLNIVSEGSNAFVMFQNHSQQLTKSSKLWIGSCSSSNQLSYIVNEDSKEKIIVTEGIADAIALYACGYTSATSGSAYQNAKIISGMSDKAKERLHWCVDDDATGIATYNLSTLTTGFILSGGDASDIYKKDLNELIRQIDSVL